MGIYDTLIPLYITDQNLLPYERLDDSYCDEREIVTASLQNNPILSSWYFSWDTCYKIAQLDVWKNKRIMFLGTPRLFEYFASRCFGEELVLVDLDGTVIDALSKKYTSLLEKNHKTLFYKADINSFNVPAFLENHPGEYDYIFLDPPWYPSYYMNWINIALQVLSSNGTILFSLFPRLLRPTAQTERREIMEKCCSIAEKAFICSGILEYDIPSFEKKELENEGLILRSNWKTSDLVILNGVTNRNFSDASTINETYSVWLEFAWLGCRWFLDTSRSFPSVHQLISSPEQTLYLKNPSKRNVQLHEVNLLSSTKNSLHRMLKNKKYIGTYEYNGEVCIENAVPPIVEVEIFNKVQELLKYNQAAGAHKKAKVDYLLTEKLFCGKCGTMMVGVCGTSKTGVRYHYYMCTQQKKKQCTKKAVRQAWIENLVLEYVINLVQDDALLDYIAESTYQYYLAQNTDTSYTKSLQKALAETERAIANLLRAIEAGVFNDSTKDRMNELEEQKAELKAALAAAKLKEDMGLKKEHIVFFLHQFADMDYSDIACQKRLIKTFVNSVFVYDDKVVLTFNYSGDRRTMTLKEIDGGLQQGIRIPRAVVHQITPGKQLFSGCFTVF